MQRTQPITDLSTFSGKYVTPMQLAVYVGVTRRTIYHHIEKGALRAVPLGDSQRVLRIPIAEARRYAGEATTPHASISA